MSDLLHRFLVQQAPVRGELICLDEAWREIVSRHDLPGCVRDRLGELCVAGLMLSASLKFDGALVLQIQGDGPVALMVVECESDGRLRATTKLRDGASCPPEASLQQLVNLQGRGRFMVTLDPRKSSVQKQAYQGIVPFEGKTISEVLERYMARSEQLPTRLWLACDATRAAGLMLQRLPDAGGHVVAVQDDPDEAWERMQHLADTVTADELRSLPADQILHRLFWQESLHAFDARPVRFACSCSRMKVSNMLRMLGAQEIDAILAEQGQVSVRCDFCNTPWTFDAVDCARLFVSDSTSPLPEPRTRH
jgi:molecular chaperone Hsp33